MSIIIGLTTGCGEKPSDIAMKTKARLQSEQSNTATQSTNNKTSDSNTTTNSKGDKITILEKGKENPTGKLGITVLDTIEDTAISVKAGDATASGKFVIIQLNLNNKGTTAIQYANNNFVLGDTVTKATYKIDDNAFQAMGHLNAQETIFNKNNQFIGVYSDFNPGMSKKTYLVFDVPSNVDIKNCVLLTTYDESVWFNLK